MKTIPITLFFTLLSFSIYAQEEVIKSDSLLCEANFDSLLKKEVYTIVNIPAHPKNGMGNLYKKFGEELRITDKSLIKRLGISPKIYIGFVVDKNSKLQGFRIVRSNFPKEDVFIQQIINILTDTAWNPGKCKDQFVDQLIILPINIHLQY